MQKSIGKFASLFLAFCLFFSVFSCQIGDFDNTVDVHITFYINDPNNDNKVTTSECILHINKGSFLTGTPNDWAEDWSINTINQDALYGYVGDGKNGQEGVPYRFASIGGAWYFKHMQPLTGSWDSSYKVTKSIHITPDYVSDSSEVAVVFNFAYYTKIGDEYALKKDEIYSYTEKELSGDIYINTLVENSGLFKQDKDSELSYGYIDKNDHNHKYFFDSTNSSSSSQTYYFNELGEDGKLVLDEDGYPVVWKSEDKITIDFDGKILTPAYISAGFVNIPASADEAGGIPGVEQVFIPGNVKGDGEVFPFPYSRSIDSGRNRIEEYTNSGNIYKSYNSSFVNLTDNPTTRYSIADMYVMEVPVTSELLNTMKGSLGSKYTFSTTLKSDYIHTCDYSYVDACIMANMLTEYYNTTHEEQLTYAYYSYPANQNSIAIVKPNQEDQYIFQDANVMRTYAPANTTYYFPNAQVGALTSPQTARCIIFNESATGFRMPWQYEWEYWARIITDERQVPNENVYSNATLVKPLFTETDGNSTRYSTILKPTSQNGYQYYFQSAKGWFDNTNESTLQGGSAYVGSGAGLAYYDNISAKYDKKQLRKFIEATGRVANLSARTRNQNIDMMKTAADGTPDVNRKNGAGLYGMTGTLHNLLNYGADCYMGGYPIAAGGSYQLVNDYTLSIVNFATFNKLSPAVSGKIADSTVRFCRVAR